METISRQKFLKYLGFSGAAFLVPPLSSSFTSFPKPSPPANDGTLYMAHMTDIHVQSGRAAEDGFASTLQTINGYKEKPDFILNGGDSIMNSALNLSREKVKKQWDLFHDILKNNNSLPIHHCLGNHDLYGWTSPDRAHEEAKQWALDEYKLSRSYYAFEKGNWKFIVLDSIHGRDTIPGYFGKLDEVQREWLEQELASTPNTFFICIVTHIPILAICTLFDHSSKNSEHWSIPNNTLHADAKELTTLFHKYPNIKACLSGHIHMIDHVNYLGIDYFCNGAVSGSWWKGDFHEFPPSFSMMRFSDTGRVEREIIYYDWQRTS
jgi:Icc protein